MSCLSSTGLGLWSEAEPKGWFHTERRDDRGTGTRDAWRRLAPEQAQLVRTEGERAPRPALPRFISNKEAKSPLLIHSLTNHAPPNSIVEGFGVTTGCGTQAFSYL